MKRAIPLLLCCFLTACAAHAPDKSNLIRITSPQPGGQVSFPLSITGEARGSWYFEATFPVVLTDGTGKEIAHAYATAQKDWMTEDFVPFTASIEEAYPETETGMLILRYSNASGDPDRDDQLLVPVRF